MHTLQINVFENHCNEIVSIEMLVDGEVIKHNIPVDKTIGYDEFEFIFYLEGYALAKGWNDEEFVADIFWSKLE